MILEYDLAGISTDLPAPPGVFIVPLDMEDESRTGKLYGEPEPLAAALWAVSGWTPDAAILRQVRRVYQAMTPMGPVAQAGVSPGRPQRVVRLPGGSCPRIGKPGGCDDAWRRPEH